MLTDGFRGVEQAWRLGLLVLAEAAKGAVGGAPPGADGTSAYKVRDLKGGKVERGSQLI
uniref:Predicted protein n=1 Tax=Hordeum vulgare subsp. vulgare TaxID=112509 RepID=F2EK89_HORVV|nr:predicted protein [Hordeum vulgare subsp. vulgare]